MITQIQSDVLFSIDKLSFSYRNHAVINQLSLSMKKGEIFTLIGPNGCGKSTLLRLINGVMEEKYNKNKITILGKCLSDYQRKELAQTVAVLPQNRNTPDICVSRFIEHGRFPYLDLTRHLSEKDQILIQKALQIMQLEDLRDVDLTSLSGGERQRAYIALTIAQDTPLILLDEPTTYLDINYQFELLNTIRHLNQASDKSILMVLHDLNLALKYSDRIGVMDHGQLLYTGTPSDLIQTDILKQIFNVTCTAISLNGHTEYVIQSILNNWIK